MSLFICFFEVVSVILIQYFIVYFKEPASSEYSLLTLTIVFLSIKLISIFLSRQFFMIQTMMGFKAGAQLNCLIYDKVLKVSPANFKEKKEPGRNNKLFTS